LPETAISFTAISGYTDTTFQLSNLFLIIFLHYWIQLLILAIFLVFQRGKKADPMKKRTLPEQNN